MPSRRKNKTIAFKWKNGIKIFLPTVVITNDLRRLADTIYSKRTVKMDADEQEDWNPSWSDEDDELSVPVAGTLNNGYHENRQTLSEEETTTSTTDNDGSEKDDLDNTVAAEKNESTKQTGSNLFRRKFYSKEELFKNLTSNKSREGESKKSSNVSRNNGKNTESNSYTSSTKSRKPTEYYSNVETTKTVQPVNFKSDAFKCKECGKGFNKKLHLTLHEKIHAKMDKPSTRISITEQRSETNKNLTNSKNAALSHKTNMEVDKFVCEKCDRCFERSNQLKFHRKLCKATLEHSSTVVEQKTTQQPKDPKDKRFTSTVCSEISTASVKKFSCTDCRQEFKLQHSLNLHKRSHVRTCSNCSLTFHEAVFQEHFDICYSSTVSKNSERVSDLMSCITCGKTCADEATLGEHQMLHKYSIETFEDGNSDYFDYFLPFSCHQKGCESRFSANADLDNHLRMKHNVDTSGVSNPTYYYIQDQQLPPLNPYVLITQEIKQSAAELLKKAKKTKRHIPTTKLLKRRLKKFRGGRVREDIPFQDEYTCETCGEKFYKRNLYLFHLREEKYKCIHCDRGFQSASLLEAHVKLHSDPNYEPGRRGRGRVRDDVPFQDEYTCETCGEKFDKRNLYLIHLREEKFKCTLCDRRFQAQSLLEAHVKLHSDPNYDPGRRGRVRDDVPFQDEYTCETCGEKFDKRNLYLLHLREEKFRCNLCDRRFQAQSLLEAHVKLHSDPNYDPGRRGRVREDIPFQDEYTCETCGEKFNKRNLYLFHLREEKFKCALCDRRFQSASLLEAHVKLHSDPNYDPGRRGRVREDVPFQDEYTCETCGEKFDKRNLYLLHLREEKFKCTICDRRFQSAGLLESHVKRHSDPNYEPGRRGRIRDDIPFQSVYTCETCEKQFEDRSYFLIHLSQHKREEKYKCKLCGMKHLSSLSLKRHMERHSDPSYVPGRGRGRRFRHDIPIQSVYTCEKCERKFDNRNVFLIHVAKHNREERFTCKICHMKHVSSFSLQLHMKRHSDPTYRPRHPKSSIPVQDVYNCETCNRTFVNRQRYICHLYYHRNAGTQTSTGSIRRKRRSDIPVQDVYYCEKCGYSKAFTDRMKYIIHLNNHNQEKRHKCDGCLKLFKSVQARDVHQTKFCKGIPCKYKCDRCKDMFHTKIMLARHFEKYHSKSLISTSTTIEYPCNQCSQTFNTTFGLTRHQQIYHPVAEVTLEHESPKITNDYQDNSGENSPHSWSPEEDNPVLAASFCEIEMDEAPTVDEKSQSKPPPKRKQSGTCQCGVNKKYKSQKFCHSLRCPCVQAGNRCSNNCDCDTACLNNNEMEDQQQQKFRDGKVSMMLEDGVNIDEEMNASTPVVIGYSHEPFDENYPDEEPEPSTSSLGYSKLIPTSEFITVDDGQDESMRQLELEGYVEEAEDVDPLADPIPVPQVPQILEESKKPISANNSPTLIINTAATKSHNTAGNSVSSPAPRTVISTSATTSGKQNNIEASFDSFNQTANLRCQFCKKNFKIMPTYISHILLHEVEKALLSCPICSKTFENQVSSFMQHLDRHNRGIDLQCTKCSSKFKSYGDMDKHLRVHHFQPFECGICRIKFPNPQDMMSHWSKVHPTCQCGLCNVKFFSYDDLTFHMKSLHSPYDCLRCNNRFENLRKLLDHIATSHASAGSARTHVQTNSRQSSFKCDYCDACFSNGEDLNEHLSNHLSTSQNVSGEKRSNHHQCGQCEATFTSLEDLHDHLAHHIMGTNQAVNSHQSSTIRNPISTGSNTVHNMNMDNDVIEVEQVMDDPVNDNIQPIEVLTCPKCGRGFRNRNAWRVHLISHNLFLCSACDSTFDIKGELVDHLQLNSCIVHFCEICDRNFQAKKYLVQHKKFVHGEKRSSMGNINSVERGSFSVEAPSFPVIVASTSLAQNRSVQAEPNTYTSFTRVTSTQDEIEEIVLD